METNDLIRRLTRSAGPVRRLQPPWVRAVQWLAIALPAVGLVVFLMSPREDLAVRFAETRFLVEQTAAFATAVTAAIAAFCMTVPGYGRAVVLLPLLPLAVWLGSLGQGCVQAWLLYGPDGLRLAPDWICFPSIVVVGAVPAVAMAVMLRRGAPMAPRLTVAFGALAAGALANVGLRLFHEQDASLMVLVWQFGSVALLSAAAGWSGGRLLRWSHAGATG